MALVLLASVSAAVADGPSSLPYVIQAVRQHAARVARRHLHGEAQQSSGRRREQQRAGTYLPGDREERNLRIVRGSGVHRKSARGAVQAVGSQATARLHVGTKQGAAVGSHATATGLKGGLVRGVGAGAGSVAWASGADGGAVPTGPVRTPPPPSSAAAAQEVRDGRQRSIDVATQGLGDSVPTPEEVLPLLPAGSTPNYVKKYATRVFRPDVVVAKDGSGNFIRIQVCSLGGPCFRPCTTRPLH